MAKADRTAAPPTQEPETRLDGLSPECRDGALRTLRALYGLKPAATAEELVSMLHRAAFDLSHYDKAYAAPILAALRRDRAGAQALAEAQMAEGRDSARRFPWVLCHDLKPAAAGLMVVLLHSVAHDMRRRDETFAALILAALASHRVALAERLLAERKR